MARRARSKDLLENAKESLSNSISTVVAYAKNKIHLLIHFLTDHGFPQIDMFQALAGLLRIREAGPQQPD